MSFTAEVRDELARCEPECEYCDLSTLAALTRVSGTLSLAGSGRYRLTVATETGAVARTMITLTHRILKLKTEFTVRKSVLHKVRNYLITLPDQPDLDKALVLLGILCWPFSLIALVAGLFLGLRYAFRGPDMGDQVNAIMDKAADAAQGKNEPKA